MQTVLLADDERLFRSLEGTCLRREIVRLCKAPPAALVATASRDHPDLILLALDDASHRILRDLCGAMPLDAIPIIALDFSGSTATPLRIHDSRDRAGPV